LEKVNVMVTTDVGEELLGRINRVSPKVNLLDASRVWHGPVPLGKPGAAGADDDKILDGMLAQAEVIYGFSFPQNVVSRAPNLKWLQTMSAGVDRLLTPEIANSAVILTNAHGIHGASVGETAVGMLFLFAKRMPFCLENKRLKRWERFAPDLLGYQTVGILGLGVIGRAVARMCKTFGMRVIGTRRTVTKTANMRYVDEIIPRERWHELFGESDYVVNVLPLTPETDRIVGEKELRSMKKSAYFINVGRGRTVDEEALVRALEERWIAGAGLDAFAREPLPPESRLWELPNVYISPHIAGGTRDYNELTTAIFCDNLERYIAGKKLRHIVNKELGY
jgi:phosphoglycerate dehydrogenase-like enzyme